MREWSPIIPMYSFIPSFSTKGHPNKTCFENHHHLAIEKHLPILGQQTLMAPGVCLSTCQAPFQISFKKASYISGVVPNTWVPFTDAKVVEMARKKATATSPFQTLQLLSWILSRGKKRTDAASHIPHFQMTIPAPPTATLPGSIWLRHNAHDLKSIRVLKTICQVGWKFQPAVMNISLIPKSYLTNKPFDHTRIYLPSRSVGNLQVFKTWSGKSCPLMGLVKSQKINPWGCNPLRTSDTNAGLAVRFLHPRKKWLVLAGSP